MRYSLTTWMIAGPPVLAGLFPLRALYLLLVIFGIIIIAALGTYWSSRRVYSEDLDEETVERMKNLEDRHP
jgi:FtsZ-interacting cell division protein ZipA